VIAVTSEWKLESEATIRLSTGKSDRAEQEVLDSKNKVLSSERKSSQNRRIRQYFAILSTATVLRGSEIARQFKLPFSDRIAGARKM
jgi:hypothetical protein